MEAAKVIDEFEPRDMMDALVDALTAGDENVRNAAANALADLKDPSAAPALLKALEKDDAFVITAILRSLKQLRIADARSKAIGFLLHASPGVRREAVGVLGYLQDAQNLPQLISVGLNDAHAEVRRAAIGSLVFGSPAQVADALISALHDEHWQVRVEASRGLGRLKVLDATQDLIKAVNDELWQVSEAAANALGQLKAVDAIPALGECFTNPISNLRKAAAAAMGEIAHADGLIPLETAANDNDPDVRKIARWAIGEIEKASALAGSESL
jgi:HEAT repeat protein